MNDYVSYSEISPVDRAGTRASPPVSAVQPVSPRATAVPDRVTRGIASAPETDTAKLDDETAGAAEYAKVHARIAVIMADLRSDNSTSATVNGAEGEIQSMLPQPTVLVPLPPASKEAVEYATQLAKRIVQQAFYAHSAQANVQRGTVDQVVSTDA